MKRIPIADKADWWVGTIHPPAGAVRIVLTHGGRITTDLTIPRAVWAEMISAAETVTADMALPPERVFNALLPMDGSDYRLLELARGVHG